MTQQPRRPRMQNVDFGKTASDYATHRAGFPERLWDELEKCGQRFSGKRTLDLGTGTGAVARALALRGATVTGLDPSTELTDQAQQLDAAAGITIDYVAAKAEDTGLSAASFDLVVCGQAWWWFDNAAATAEAMRLLSPGGTLLICSFDWLTLPGNLVEATEALIVDANPKWTVGGRDGRHPSWIDDLTNGGFADVQTLEFDHGAPYTHEAWRGRIRASAGVAASLPPDEVERFDERLAALMAERFPDDPLIADHRVYAAWGSKP